MHFVTGILAMLLIALNTMFVCIPLFLAAAFRLVAPRALATNITRWMDLVIVEWTGFNRLLFRTLRLTEIETTWRPSQGASGERWYMVVSNHQSWTDILILQTTLFGVLPPLRFFTKQQLIWIPLLGVAMWLLGFPYVRRATAEDIKKNPALKNADRDSVERACVRFRNHPTCVLNFLEGTRFTAEKKAIQNNDYIHLLSPRIGGLAYVIDGLQPELGDLIDVTIAYPSGVPDFWTFLSGRCERVVVTIDHHPIADTIIEDLAQQDRASLVAWVEALWRDKDARLNATLG